MMKVLKFLSLALKVSISLASKWKSNNWRIALTITIQCHNMEITISFVYSGTKSTLLSHALVHDLQKDSKCYQPLFRPRTFYKQILIVIYSNLIVVAYNNGLVQDCSNSIDNALELRQSCTKPSMGQK